MAIRSLLHKSAIIELIPKAFTEHIRGISPQNRETTTDRMADASDMQN
jgi:hypothetical protein